MSVLVADPDERRRRRIALVLALGLNCAFLLTLRQLMVSTPLAPPSPPAADAVLLLRLIDPADAPPSLTPLPMPAEPVPPPRTSAAATRVPTRVRDGAAATIAPRANASANAAAADVQPLAAATPASTPALQLFDADGRVALPGSTPVPATAFPLGPRPGTKDLFVHRSPLPYAPTRFEKAWAAPVGETFGGELLRHATVSKTWRTPWGTEVRCSFVLVLGGCGWGFSPQDTIEEMQRVRADPPLPKTPPAAPAPPDSP